MSGDGRGSESIYSGSSFANAWGKFKDESFELANDRGSLSMANAGKDGNGSQFFVCLKRGASWDGKHVVFGRVVSGLRLFDRISSGVNVDPSASHRPLPGFRVTIEDCGLMPSSYKPPVLGDPLRNPSWDGKAAVLPSGVVGVSGEDVVSGGASAGAGAGTGAVISAAPSSTPSSGGGGLWGSGGVGSVEAGGWRCDTCLVNNKANDTTCPCCSTVRPGSSSQGTGSGSGSGSVAAASVGSGVTSAGTLGFTFGFNAPVASTASTAVAATTGASSVPLSFGSVGSSSGPLTFTFGTPSLSASTTTAAASATASATPAAAVAAPASSTSSGVTRVHTTRSYVYMNIRVETPAGGDVKAEKVVFELFGDVVPLTAENFRCLCTGEKVRGGLLSGLLTGVCVCCGCWLNGAVASGCGRVRDSRCMCVRGRCGCWLCVVDGVCLAGLERVVTHATVFQGVVVPSRRAWSVCPRRRHCEWRWPRQ